MKICEGNPVDFPPLSQLAQELRWERFLGFLEKALADGDVLVARSGDRIAGMLIWNRTFFSRPFIWLLGVAPEAQHRGVASALISEVEAACTGESLFISTNTSNAPMRGLCEKLGFARSGYLENLDPGDPEIFYFKQL